MSKVDLKKAPFRKDGRVIVSYPKSGRTWVRFALTECGIDADFTHAGASTNRREIGLAFRGVAPQLKGIPLVFLHRNPIDTAVSMFHQVTRRDLRKGSGRYYRMFLPLLLKGALPPSDIDSFVLHPTHGIEKICAYNRAWLDYLAKRDDCLVLTYEEMRAHPNEGFQALLDFFGETGATGRQLAEAATFEKMKAAEKNDASGILSRTNRSDPQSAKVRKGKVGGYVDELRPETVAECRRIAAGYGFGESP
jgi:hypothetical protein